MAQLKRMRAQSETVAVSLKSELQRSLQTMSVDRERLVLLYTHFSGAGMLPSRGVSCC